jgi:hypothetical protein
MDHTTTKIVSTPNMSSTNPNSNSTKPKPDLNSVGFMETHSL